MTKCITDIIDDDRMQKETIYSFVEQIITRSGLKIQNEYDPVWVEQKIKILESEVLSLEKIVIEKILQKKITWFKFLAIIRILDLIEIGSSTLISLNNDCRENAALRILDIVDYQFRDSTLNNFTGCDLSRFNRKWVAI
ncbi:MAG: hypothetical protein ACXAB7_02625 [Candidatus Kariarchaeaceae archaeon]|jgi:hypothetical protein